MNRNSLLETAGRSFHQAVRMTLDKSNDNPLMQEMDFAGMFSEGRKLVERVQAFGFSSVPLPRIAKQAMQAAGAGGKSKLPEIALQASDLGGGGGGADISPQQQGAAAEGIALFIGGQRNHPTVIAIDDRRNRPMGLKPGENAQYDDAHQMTLIRRDGAYLLSNDNPDDEGKSPERMASLRHVEKKKQQRQKGDQQGSQGGAKAGTRAVGQQQQSTDHSNYKHEGETVNTEVRVTKKKIEFYNGEQQVGEHDKASQKWNMKGKEFNATPSDAANINSKQVTINGSTGIDVNGPTNINGSPVMTDATLPAAAVITALLERVAALEARLTDVERR